MIGLPEAIILMALTFAAGYCFGRAYKERESER